MIYRWAMIIGILFGICSCTNQHKDFYAFDNIEAYKGQSVSDLFDSNGAPNRINNLSNGSVEWIYYTNYRPVGGVEIISFDEPNSQNNTVNCTVRVIILNNIVQNIYSNCE